MLTALRGDTDAAVLSDPLRYLAQIAVEPDPGDERADDEVAVGYTRTNGFLHVDYELNDHVTLFGQGIYGKNSANQRRESIDSGAASARLASLVRATAE